MASDESGQTASAKRVVSPGYSDRADAWQSVGFRAFRQILRPDPHLVAELRGFSTCDLSDVMFKSHTMGGISAVADVSRVAGTAVTVAAHSGGLNIIKYAAALTAPGDVLVVDAHGDTAFALWGGNVSKALLNRGVVALVIDGAVRDVSEIRELGFPVFARAVATAFREHTAARGEVNVPVACGGIVVNPGDVVVGDSDGVVVVPRRAVASVAERARALQQRLEAAQPELAEGRITNIDQICHDLRGSGLVEIDETYDRSLECDVVPIGKPGLH
jgi:4-hydroxy-4-methyl-2-oxoglutarate aldolase